MDKATTILVYILAGIGCAWGWRFLLPRYVFRFKNRLLAVVLAYVSMAGAFAATYAYLGYANWSVFTSQNDQGAELAGLIFFLAPFGLPVAIGAPVVLFFDIIIGVFRYFTRNSGSQTA